SFFASSLLCFFSASCADTTAPTTAAAPPTTAPTTAPGIPPSDPTTAPVITPSATSLSPSGVLASARSFSSSATAFLVLSFMPSRRSLLGAREQMRFVRGAEIRRRRSVEVGQKKRRRRRVPIPTDVALVLTVHVR